MYPIDINDLAKEILLFFAKNDPNEPIEFPLNINEEISSWDSFDKKAEELEKMIGNYNLEYQKSLAIANAITLQAEKQKEQKEKVLN